MTNLEHALNILQGIIDDAIKTNGPYGRLALIKSYLLSEMEENEKSRAIRLDTKAED